MIHIGDFDGIQTHDPLIKSQVHLSTELRSHIGGMPTENRTQILGLEDRCSIR